MKALFGCGIGLCTISMVLACGVSSAETMLVNDFGDGVQSWRFDFGGPITPNLSQDPTEGSPDNAQGALRMDMTFAAGQSESYAFTGDVFFPATDLSGFDTVEFDLKIADGAALDAFGNHGYFQFVSRETDGYSFNSVLGENLAPVTGEWTTYSAPADSMTATRAFTVQLYGGPDQNIDGAITLFLDNIRLTSVIPEPTSFTILSLLACSAIGYRRR